MREPNISWLTIDMNTKVAVPIHGGREEPVASVKKITVHAQPAIRLTTQKLLRVPHEVGIRVK